MLRLFYSLAVLALAAPLAAAPRADLFVSPNGNDAWSGRLAAPNADGSDGPLATVRHAQQAVRRLRRDHAGDRPLVVLVRGGTYRLSQSIVFQADDSGTEQSPTVYRAYPGERPVLSGGVSLSDWTVDDAGRWRTTLPKLADRDWVITQLFVDNQRRYRPRLPKQGYYRVAGELPPSPEAEGRGHNRFAFADEAIRSDWHRLGDVEVLTAHQWTMSRLRIAAVDSEAGHVTLAGRTASNSRWGRFLKGHRFLVENVREALTEPGQWYLDSETRELTYLPKPGETPETTEVVAPRLTHLVLFQGDPAAARWVEHVYLEGLTLAHAHWATPPTGQSFPQAEVNLDGAVSAMGARNCALRRCAVRHVGGYAMAFGHWCRHNLIEGCELVDVGAGGVRIGAGGGAGAWHQARLPHDDEQAAVTYHTIRDCTIAHLGRMHSAGIGVWIGHASHNLVEHNDIFDMYYSSVSVGWSWGYAPTKAHHNVIRANHMHTIGQGVLSDMGGVYTLGDSPGTVVELNRIHDVHAFDYGGWGLYTDEGSTGIVMRNNVVYRTKTGSFHQHYGKENRIENNILVDSRMHQIQRTRQEPHRSFVFQRNIVYWQTGPLLASNWGDNQYLLDANVYWRHGDDPAFDFAGRTLDAWRAKGQDRQSIVADPKFVDPEHDDYRLQPDSPALKVGFEPFDQTLAGRRSEVALTSDLPPVPGAFPTVAP